MITDSITPLAELAAHVRRYHAHAAHRARLLEQAERLLSVQLGYGTQLGHGANSNGGADSGPGEPNKTSSEGTDDHQRTELAEKLERWRYQHLHETDGGRLSPSSEGPCEADRRLVDALDTTARRLRWNGANPARRLSPRSTRRAVESDAPTAALERAEPWLHPEADLDALIDQAGHVTRQTARRRAAGRRRMLLYAPLYLSSHCVNHCVYCGFRYPAEVERRHLDAAEAERQADILADRGMRHILLVAGDFPALTTTGYFVDIIQRLRRRDLEVAVEIAPQSTASYAAMVDAGACGITLYQETYQRDLYTLYHPRGSKADYDWRIEGLDRAAEAGFRRLGLGVLLGLADPWDDVRAMLRHAGYLAERFPEQCLAFSLPRIHETPREFEPPVTVDDATLVRLYCALRIAMPEATLVLSTRESPVLRDRLAEICIDQFSAGSSTTPGGYTGDGRRTGSGEQFPVSDHRSPADVVRRLEEIGCGVVWRAEGP